MTKKKEAESLVPISKDQSVIWNPKRVFSEEKGKVLIGGEEIKPEFLKVLKEQAIYIGTSQLFEIMINTARAEAMKMALAESQNWDHVLSAKMLKYWSDIFDKMVKTLQK